MGLTIPINVKAIGQIIERIKFRINRSVISATIRIKTVTITAAISAEIPLIVSYIHEYTSDDCN